MQNGRTNDVERKHYPEIVYLKTGTILLSIVFSNRKSEKEYVG